jgi:hypothetical protein
MLDLGRCLSAGKWLFAGQTFKQSVFGLIVFILTLKSISFYPYFNFFSRQSQNGPKWAYCFLKINHTFGPKS